MKSYCSMLILLMLAFSFLSANELHAHDKVGQNFLGIRGTEIRDNNGDGQVVRLRGVNLGGWLEWQDWMCPMDSSGTLKDLNPGHNGYNFELRHLLTKRFGPVVAKDLIETWEDSWITSIDIDNIHSLGMNAVRLTFAYDSVVNTDGSWREDAFQKMDWFVSEAWKRGIYTILDYHAFLPERANQDGSRTGYWANPKDKSETLDIWKRIALHFKGNPAIAMYDLLNEPNNSALWDRKEPDAATVCKFYSQIYTTIRNVDPDHIIAMEGVWDWKTLPNPKDKGFLNIIYSFHLYHTDKKTAKGQIAAFKKDLAGIVKMQSLWHIPCLIGEFNLEQHPEAWGETLNAFDASGLSWIMWTYKNKRIGSNSWGLYTAVRADSVTAPNLTIDDPEMIRSKWKNLITRDDVFKLNPVIGPIIREQMTKDNP